MDAASLGVPPGLYDLRARVTATLNQPAYSFEVDTAVSLDPQERSLYNLELTGEESAQNPQVLEFWLDDQMVERRPLDTFEVI